MSSKVGHINVFGLNFTFVFRHRYEKDEENILLNKFTMWNKWELGFFFKHSKIVGKRRFSVPKEWKNNLVSEYMFGINLLICKIWFTVSRGAMKLKVNEKH